MCSSFQIAETFRCTVRSSGSVKSSGACEPIHRIAHAFTLTNRHTVVMHAPSDGASEARARLRVSQSSLPSPHYRPDSNRTIPERLRSTRTPCAGGSRPRGAEEAIHRAREPFPFGFLGTAKAPSTLRDAPSRWNNATTSAPSISAIAEAICFSAV